jgi:hypothetical protein
VPSSELLENVQPKNGDRIEAELLAYRRAAPAMTAPKKTAAFSTLFWPAAPVYGEAVAGLTELLDALVLLLVDTVTSSHPLDWLVGETGLEVVTIEEIGCHPLL